MSAIVSAATPHSHTTRPHPSPLFPLRPARPALPRRPLTFSIDKEITESGIAIRIYTPTDAATGNGPLPVGVFAHGGGHINGGAWASSFEDKICRFVSQHSNVIVAQVDFRLAPEHPVPAQLNDVFDAYKWVNNTCPYQMCWTER